MNFTQLQYFIELAQVEHYGKAARSLYVSQPALSNSIKRLEAELGFELFERVGRNVVLSDSGKKFYEHALRAVHEIKQGKELATQRSETISIALVSSIQRVFLPTFLREFTAAYAQPFDFDLFEERTTARCMQALQQGKVDFAFCGNVPDETDVEWIPVLSQDLCVAFNLAHPLAVNKQVNMDNLKEYPLISYRKTSDLYWPVLELTSEYGLSVREAFEDEESGCTQVFATNTTAAALLLDSITEATKENVAVIPLSDAPSPFHIVYVAYKKRLLLSTSEHYFVDFCKEHMVC